jgi:hypothetical protein
MKESNNIGKKNLSGEVIKPVSLKNNKNYLESFNHFFPDEINIPDNLNDNEIEALKDKNKWFFYEYTKLVEKNNLLKFKLQELISKKNEFHKYLNKLENKDKNVNNSDNINNNSSISHDLINFQSSNIYINRKRKRRKKNQIVCKYKCNYKDCNKKYATEGALNQHIKLKHI